MIAVALGFLAKSGLMGPLGKLLGIALLLVSLVGAGALWLHSHDNAVRAAMQASADRAIAAEQAKQHVKVVQALEAQAASTGARLQRMARIQQETHAAPPSTGCVNSPAMRALLDGLRHPSNGPVAAP